MLKNSGYKGNTTNLLDLQKGGSFLVRGIYVFILKSIFQANGGLFAGGLFCLSPKLRLSIQISVFIQNYGYIGGAIMIASDVVDTIAEIKNSFFSNNIGYRNFKIKMNLK
jgi:hypothetical protein